MARCTVGRQADASKTSTESSCSRNNLSLPELACVVAMNSFTGLFARSRSKSICAETMSRSGFRSKGLICPGEK